MLVTPYLYKLYGYQHLLLHRKRLSPGGIFESYAGQFEAIWAQAYPNSEAAASCGLRIIGVYSDPGHVFAYGDGEVRQEFSICLASAVTGGSLGISDESTAIGFFPREDLAGMRIHPSIRKRIEDYFNDQPPVLR